MDIAANRLANQHVVGRPLERPEDVVRWLGAVQSQDYGAAKWGVAQRTPALTDADLNDAFNAGRILRTHVLRPTWHFVAPEDIRWILRLTAPRVHGLNNYYYRQCGLDSAIFDKTERAMRSALERGNYLTRKELAKVFEKDGIEASGLGLACIVMRAELDGVICSGPLLGKQFTYALLDERAPGPAHEPGDLTAELARRYFRSHGPAMLNDFAYWSSLTIAEARAGLEANGAELVSHEWEGKTYWSSVTASQPVKGASIRLLPNYDEHIVNYKDYTPLFDPQVGSQVDSSSPSLQAHILISSGKVIGGWRRTVAKKCVEIEVSLLRPLDDQERSLLEVEAGRYRRFLGIEKHRVIGG